MGLSDRSNLLFSNLDLRASLDARRHAIDSEVRALDPNRLLNTSPDDLARFPNPAQFSNRAHRVVGTRKELD